MSTYSTQFFAGALPIGTTTLVTGPPSDVLVIRDIELANTGSGPQNVTVFLVGPGGTGYLLAFPALGSGTVTQWEGRVVLKTGDKLEAFCQLAGTTIIVSGYTLSS